MPESNIFDELLEQQPHMANGHFRPIQEKYPHLFPFAIADRRIDRKYGYIVGSGLQVITPELALTLYGDIPCFSDPRVVIRTMEPDGRLENSSGTKSLIFGLSSLTDSWGGNFIFVSEKVAKTFGIVKGD